MNIDVGATVGDYQVIGVLGAGGMGKVFKVRNTISDRMEAMKVLLPDLAGEPDLADRFLREIKVQASLSHPNIASLHTALRFENQLLMFMELVEGVTLEERLRQGPLSVEEGIAYISQVLAALGYAHQHGVTHRDIKPANMMLTANGVIKLMDFGIAKGEADRKLTMTGTTLGSLYYMSPEQIRGVQSLDPRSDLYSVGVSLYELVTGKRPFDGDSQFAIMSAHLEKTPVPPITIDPRLPASLNDAILFSVQKDPAQRFQSAEAFRNALASVAAGLGTAPASQPQMGPALIAPTESAPSPGSRSRRTLWVLAGAICAAAAIVGIIQFAPFKKTSAHPPAAQVQTAAPTPTPPAAAPPAETTASPVATPAPAAAPPPALAKQPAVASPAAAVSSPRAPRNLPETRPQQRAAERPAVSSPLPAVASPPPSVSSAPAQQPAPAQQTQAPSPPPQPDLSAKRAELQRIREALVKLSARASAIHSTMQNIQRSQAASGLGMRRDWVEAASLMDSFLQGANDALRAGDAASAQDFLNKAETQVEKLDNALH